MKTIIATMVFTLTASALRTAPLELGSRLELFVDDYVVERFEGNAALHVHKPGGREVVLATDKPWEEETAGYFAVSREDSTYRMYYRAHHHGSGEKPRGEPMCYAESRDGLHWVKPNLGLFMFKGSADNNIVLGGDDEKFPATPKWRGKLGFETDLGWRGDIVPFKDTNPGATQDAKYKALVRGCRGPHQVLEGQSDYGMYPMKSPDGIHWTLMSEKPVISNRRLDTQNVAFWDVVHGRYVAFVRHLLWRNAGAKEAALPEQVRPGGIRDVHVSFSRDFVNWSEPVPLQYPGDQDREIYTNGITSYERAPHILIGLATELTNIFSVDQVHPILMVSRDGGSTFRRYGDELIPNEAPQERDGNRSNYMAHGIVRGNEREYFVYATEGYGYEETDGLAGWKKQPSSNSIRLRRFVYRVDGFVSARAGLVGGAVVTKPFTFRGDKLVLNYIAWPIRPGEVRVEMQDVNGQPLKGLSLADCAPLRGDAIAQPVVWQSGASPRAHVGQPVRLRFALRHADLFSFQFVGTD
jgi:hypothetical protein